MGKETYWVKERPISDLEIKLKAGLLTSSVIFAILWGASGAMLNEYRTDSIRDGIYYAIIFIHRYSVWVAIICFVVLLVWSIIEEIQESKNPKDPKYL